MRKKTIAIVFAAFAGAAVFSCKEDPASKPAEVTPDVSAIDIQREGGSTVINLTATRDWETDIEYVSGDTRDWLTIVPASGTASLDPVAVTVSAGVNDDADREAVITFRADFIEAEVRVSQPGAHVDYTSIEEFLDAPVGDGVWYEMRGRIFLIENTAYGNFWMKDDTGILYFYGLTATQVEQNDQSFGTLGLETGDVVVLRTLRSEHNGEPEGGGTVPAYYISHSPAEDNPEDDILVSEDPSQAWLELPVVEVADDEVFTFHHTEVDGNLSRNYSMLYNTSERIALWVAYPLCGIYLGSGRTDAWGFDPNIPDVYEPVIPRSWGVAGYDRGHQIPSGSRNADDDMNEQTFYFTNMTVQNSEFNQGLWAEVEALEREVSSNYDTLYVITGPVLDADGDGNWQHIKDNAGNSVAVPEAYFRVLLGVKSDIWVYEAVGFYYENKDYGRDYPKASDLRTVAQIEELTGITFFKNLPSGVAEDVKSQLNPGNWGL